MDNLMTMISNVGFPIVTCLYLLMRIESRMETLSSSIHELSESIKDNR